MTANMQRSLKKLTKKEAKMSEDEQKHGEEEKQRAEKKKLLIATDNFLPRWDGTARFLDEVIPYLKNDFDITVIAPIFPGYEHYHEKYIDINVIRIESSNIKWFGEYTPAKWKYRVIKEQVKKADIVWVNASGTIGAPAILAARKHRKPCISYMHSIEWELVQKSMSKKNILKLTTNFMTKLWNRFFYNKCSLIIVPTQEVGEILSLKGIKTQKKQVPLGIKVDKFMPAESKERAKEAIGINPKDKVIGYCGRIGREKDLITLYKAFQRLYRVKKDVKLLIVGEGVTDHRDVSLPEDSVMEVGTKNNVIPYLQAMDVYVLPSLTETTSLSTMEAMACGCAVVTTSVGHVARYIQNKVNGVFFPKRNDLVLYLKLRWLVEKQTVRDVLGQNARRTIVEDYNWKQTPEKIIKILKRY